MTEQNQQPQNPPEDALKPPEQAPPQPPASHPATPKVEIKDGVVMVDGKKYVKESDLMATKESLTKQLESAQATHTAAIDKLQLQVSEAQQEVARANAALEEAKQARSAGDISAEEVSRIKQEAEAAKTNLAKISTDSLNYRRQLIMATYHISADSDAGKKLMEKDSNQLDSYEEALKAVAASRPGPGNYAIGGGGAGATKMSDMDRAGALLEATPYRGVRNTPNQP